MLLQASVVDFTAANERSPILLRVSTPIELQVCEIASLETQFLENRASEKK
jgi:hypothetical protein